MSPSISSMSTHDQKLRSRSSRPQRGQRRGSGRQVRSRWARKRLGEEGCAPASAAVLVARRLRSVAGRLRRWSRSLRRARARTGGLRGPDGSPQPAPSLRPPSRCWRRPLIGASVSAARCCWSDHRRRPWWACRPSPVACRCGSPPIRRPGLRAEQAFEEMQEVWATSDGQRPWWRGRRIKRRVEIGSQLGSWMTTPGRLISRYL